MIKNVSMFPLALIVSAIPVAQAQQAIPDSRLEIPSSFNPVGSGARALGMGGAFIPVADDATAASWNPGGLIQLETSEVSIVADSLWRSENNDFILRPGGSHEGDINDTHLNYLSASFAFSPGGRNMVVSLNYQNLYEFGREWEFGLDTKAGILETTDRHHYEQDGALYALGFAYAVEVTENLALGATLNLWEDFIDSNDWQQNYSVESRGNLGGMPFTMSRDKREEYDFSGTNFNLGLWWKISEELFFGAVVKTPFDADVTHTVTESFSQRFPESPANNIDSDPIVTRTDETLKMPLSYGAGLAYRHSDQLTLAMDLYRTEWSRFAMRGEDGIDRSPLSGRPLSETGDIDDTLWARMGGEYLFEKEDYTIPLRAGVFFDPAPAEGDADEYYGFTLGSGIAYRDYVFDIAYQYRRGDDVGGDALRQVGLSQDVTEHRVYASLIVHF